MKKKILIGITVFIALAIIGALSGGNENETKETTSKDKAQVEEKQEEKINIDFSSADPKSEDFQKALKKRFKISEIKYIDEYKNLVIALDGTGELSGKTAVRNVALKGCDIMKLVHKNPAIENISISSRMETIDDKGSQSMDDVIKSSFTKDIMNQIDFDNWGNLLVQKNFYTKYYTTADTFLIYPSIQKEMPKEDIDNIYIK